MGEFKSTYSEDSKASGDILLSGLYCKLDLFELNIRKITSRKQAF